jgi:hypothetical protein
VLEQSFSRNGAFGLPSRLRRPRESGPIEILSPQSPDSPAGFLESGRAIRRAGHRPGDPAGQVVDIKLNERVRLRRAFEILSLPQSRKIGCGPRTSQPCDLRD